RDLSSARTRTAHLIRGIVAPFSSVVSGAVGFARMSRVDEGPAGAADSSRTGRNGGGSPPARRVGSGNARPSLPGRTTGIGRSSRRGQNGVALQYGASLTGAPTAHAHHSPAHNL